MVIAQIAYDIYICMFTISFSDCRYILGYNENFFIKSVESSSIKFGAKLSSYTNSNPEIIKKMISPIS